MGTRRVVTVSRKWDNPKIETVISEEGISLSISLDDFASALLKEVGSVALTFTEKGFKKKLNKAIDNVIEGVKEESIKVV